MNATETKLDIHPAAALLPIMSDDDLSKLVDDIKQHGLIEPITVFNGKILDGRSRLTACELAGVKPQFMQWNGLGEVPTRYIMTKNLRRRNFQRSQLAALAVEIAPIVRSELRELSVPMNVKLFDDYLGKIVGISHNAIFQARKIHQLSPEDFQKLKTGEGNCNHSYYKIMQQISHVPAKRIRTGPISLQEREKRTREREIRIRELTSEGYLSQQIAQELNISDDVVWDIARKGGITLHTSKAKRLDVNRIIDETVASAEALILGLDLIEDNLQGVDTKNNEAWIDSLSVSIRRLNKFIKQLRSI
jgi:hypothetical protein